MNEQVTKPKTKTGWILGGIVFIILFFNIVNLLYPAYSIKSLDERNKGMTAIAYYNWLVSPKEIVFDLVSMDGQQSALDVTRYMMQFSEAVKDRTFNKVYIAHNGKKKFYFKGDYFKNMGTEYKTQNPMYTLRTMPENTYKLDGSKAFETWTGGVLGVLGQQMKDFTELHKLWYVNDYVGK